MKYCINCGKKISNSTKFCPYCGTKQPNNNYKIHKNDNMQSNRHNDSHTSSNFSKQKSIKYTIFGTISIIIVIIIIFMFGSALNNDNNQSTTNNSSSTQSTTSQSRKSKEADKTALYDNKCKNIIKQIVYMHGHRIEDPSALYIDLDNYDTSSHRSYSTKIKGFKYIYSHLLNIKNGSGSNRNKTHAVNNLFKEIGSKDWSF